MLETACPAADFACDNKNCILASFVCNGQTECGDYSDEQNCSEFIFIFLNDLRQLYQHIND